MSNILAGFGELDEESLPISELDWPLPNVAAREFIPYIKRLGKNLTGLEIGTGRAESSYLIAEQCLNVSKLYTLDPYLEYFDWNGLVAQETLDSYKKLAIRNIEDINTKRGQEVVFLNQGFPEPLDFVFIDGDHSEAAVLEDLNITYDAVRPLGIVAVRDTNLFGSVAGIKKFRKDNKISSPIFTLSSSGVWFWYKP